MHQLVGCEFALASEQPRHRGLINADPFGSLFLRQAADANDLPDRIDELMPEDAFVLRRCLLGHCGTRELRDPIGIGSTTIP